MATTLKLRRGTTTQHATFTGALGEVTVDTDKDVIVVHDGSTAGGFPAIRAGGALGTPSSGTVTNLTGTASININGTVGATTPAAGTFTSLSDSGNLTFTGTGNRITGDFSNATVANRVMFQTSTLNGQTGVVLMPNGTNTQAIFEANSDSTGGANGSISQVGVYAAGDVRFSSDRRGTGTYLPMTFYTGGSERMRVDTSGNVGIGTSSPGSILELNKAGSGAIGPNLYLENSASSATGNASRVSFGIDAGASAASPTAYIENVKDAAGPGSSYLAFGTFGASLAERARIDASGNLLVGTTSVDPVGLNSGNGLLAVGPSANEAALNYFNATGGPCLKLGVQQNTDIVKFFRNTASVVGVGSISVTTTATTYNTSSDYRLKHDIQPMSGALAKVAQLKPVTYKWNADDSESQGFIAHELQAVVPECVTGEKDAVDSEGNPKYQGIDTSFLVATLTAGLQEAVAMIEELKAKVAALEEK
jgi:hypothetical protein